MTLLPEPGHSAIRRGRDDYGQRPDRHRQTAAFRPPILQRLVDNRASTALQRPRC